MNDTPHDQTNEEMLEDRSHTGADEQPSPAAATEESTSLVMEALQRLAEATDRFSQIEKTTQSHNTRLQDQVDRRLADQSRQLQDEIQSLRQGFEGTQVRWQALQVSLDEVKSSLSKRCDELDQKLDGLRDHGGRDFDGIHSELNQMGQRISSGQEQFRGQIDEAGRDSVRLRETLLERMDALRRETTDKYSEMGERLAAGQTATDKEREQSRQVQTEVQSLRQGFEDTQDRWQALQVSLDEVKSSFSERSDELDQKLEGLRDRSSKDFDGIKSGLGKMRQRIASDQEQFRAQISDTARDGVRLHETVVEKMDALQKKTTDKHSEMGERLEAGQSAMDKAREQLHEALMEKMDALQKETTDKHSETGERLEAGHSAMDKAREQLHETLMEKMDALRRESTDKHNEMGERLEASRASMDKAREQLHAQLNNLETQIRDQHGEMHKWQQEADNRLEAVELHGRTMQELGERLEKNHTGVVELIEHEHELAEEQREASCKEEARRLNDAGVSRHQAGDYKKARALFEQALDKDKGFAEAFNNLGLCLNAMDEREDATVAFEKAVELNPNLGPGYHNLGCVLFKRQNYQAAIKMYQEAIGRRHDTSATYTNLGKAYQEMQQTEKAIEAWKKALQIDPSNLRAARYLRQHTAGITDFFRRSKGARAK